MAQANTQNSLSLARFMELMRVEIARDLVRKINKFTHDLETVKKPDAAKDSRLVQTFFSRMESELLRHRIWTVLPDSDKQILSEGVEAYVMTKLYKRTFGRYKDDQERDQLLSSRLFALQFVTPAHLDIPIDVINDALINEPMAELQKMNAFKSPKEKIGCVLNCCQSIMNLLQSNGHETSADAFVPILNYVVIKAQPIHLISNIEYIKRFRMSSRLVAHADYYFTQLCAAAHFIESADAESFTDGRQAFLSSFLQQGLINWQQYDEAMQRGQDTTQMNRSSSTISVGNISDSDQMDGETTVLSSVDDLKSITDDPMSTRGINWTGFVSVEQLEREGQPIVNQFAASGELAHRHRFLPLKTSEMMVASVDQLLTEYKSVAFAYELLSEAVAENDTSAVLRLIAEYECKAQWRSTWPSNGQLLKKYPFLFSSFQDLAFRDVARLLNAYKMLVLHCECLIAGTKRRFTHDSLSELHPEEFEIIADRDLIDEQQPPLITRLSGDQTEVTPLKTKSRSVAPHLATTYPTSVHHSKEATTTELITSNEKEEQSDIDRTKAVATNQCSSGKASRVSINLNVDGETVHIAFELV